jgi:polygalacturonase
MATIFTVSDNMTASTLAFSSADAMLAYVRDLHADLAPEGSTLMLGGVPATNKVVKARFAVSNVGTFTVAGDGADAVATLQSKLDGAIQACAALGIDPDNVGKVGELRESLALAIESVATDDAELVLHKRRKASRKS